MKGLGFFGLIFLAILVLLVCWFIYLQLGIRDTGFSRRVARETIVIEDINKMEILKRAQKPSLKFAFYGAYDFLGKRGGYFDLTNIQSYDCIPFWQVYDIKNIPDLKGNLSKTASLIFDKYMDVFRTDGFTVPYYEIKMDNIPFPFPQTLNVEMNDQDELVFTVEKVRIADKSDFSNQITSGLSQEFEIANVNLIQTNSIKKAVEDGINSVDINGMSQTDAENEIDRSIREKIAELQQNIVQSTNFDVKIEVLQIDKQISPLSAAANVLVTIKNKNVKYLIGNELKSIPLKFRIIDGSMVVTPTTNDCNENL